jgi:hypothetical protein
MAVSSMGTAAGSGGGFELWECFNSEEIVTGAEKCGQLRVRWSMWHSSRVERFSADYLLVLVGLLKQLAVCCAGC